MKAKSKTIKAKEENGMVKMKSIRNGKVVWVEVSKKEMLKRAFDLINTQMTRTTNEAIKHVATLIDGYNYTEKDYYNYVVKTNVNVNVHKEV